MCNVNDNSKVLFLTNWKTTTFCVMRTIIKLRNWGMRDEDSFIIDKLRNYNVLCNEDNHKFEELINYT